VFAEILEDTDVSLAGVTFDISCALTGCKCSWYYQWRRRDLVRWGHNAAQKLFVAYKMIRNNTLNKYVWRGKRTKSLSDSVQL